MLNILHYLMFVVLYFAWTDGKFDFFFLFAVQSIQNGDVDQSENSVLELAEFLDSVSASVASSDSEDEDLCNNAFEMLTYTLEYIRSPSAKEVLNLFC